MVHKKFLIAGPKDDYVVEDSRDVLENLLTLAEKIDAFCEAKNDFDRKTLAEGIHAELNSLCVNFIDCTICPAEVKLRAYLLRDDTLCVTRGIGIYASMLTVMWLHGLKPELNDKATLERLSTRLKDVVEPPGFFTMSPIRRDIETVIEMLSDSSKMNKGKKLIQKIKENAGNVDQCFKKELKNESWIQHYLVISCLKMQVMFMLYLIPVPI